LKNILKSVSVLAVLTSLAFAGDEPKDLKKVIEDQGIYVETAKPGIVLSGYVDAGYSYNFAGDHAVSTRFGTDGNTTGRGSNFNLNAFKLALEKPLSTKNEWSAGFRADLIYGDDAQALAGSGTAGSSNSFLLEQAFVQLNAPIGNGVQFKIGKFVTPLGYEVIERPANQNITYGNLFQNMIPLYHTGVLASYKVNDIVDVKGGVVNGQNNDQQNQFSAFGGGSTDNGVGLLGTVNVTAPGGNANIQNGVFVSLNGANNQIVPGQSNATAWVYDIWGQWKPKFTGDKLTLGFNGDLGEGTGSTIPGFSTETTFGGAAVYAKYQFTKLFSLATRTDWMHTDNGGKFAPNSIIGTANDIYSFTATASFDIWENTLLRAEYRADYGSEGLTPASIGGDGDAIGGTTGGLTSSKGLANLVDLQVVYSF
jgi:hypothetical protein